MKTLARLTALTVFCFVSFQWWEGDRSWELVTLGTVSAVVVFWSCGGFDRGVWVGSPEVDAECARLDAELDAADVVYPERGTA